jgi:hypothetical protein
VIEVITPFNGNSSGEYAEPSDWIDRVDDFDLNRDLSGCGIFAILGCCSRMIRV